MKILQVNKFYYPQGGADKYFLDLSQALVKAGHDVAVFAMEHPNNLKTPFAKYFVSQIDFNNLTWWQKISTPGRVIYSLEAKRKFKKLVEDFQPEIIHIHNIYHQISPSILDVAKRYKIPVVMHLHDYKLICPNYQLFAHGHLCEACRPDKYYQCVKNKCFKNSRSQSLLAATEMTIHHKILKIYEKNIKAFIAPSQFMKNKISEFNWPSNKISVVTNPYSENLNNILPIDNNNPGNYLLYFGRLSIEKDIQTLILAAHNLGRNLKIVGRGPEEKNLKKMAADLPKNTAKIEFLGFKDNGDLQTLINNSEAIIIPSICYDNMPLSLLEALNMGKIVLASRIGGLPEIIKDGENGFLFEAGNLDSLQEKILNLDKINKVKIREAAFKSVQKFSPQNNLEAVIKIYQHVLNEK